jgi:DtxR family manganese transport transcriptional regulator
MSSNLPAAKRRRLAFERAREANRRETAEDYVELIDDLARDHGEARLVDLSHMLGVSAATARKVLDRLQRAGLVESRRYRGLFLTDEGRALAAWSRERHEVVEAFLLAIGVPPGAAELDAEGIEHHVSRETLQAMARFLGRSIGPEPPRSD